MKTTNSKRPSQGAERETVSVGGKTATIIRGIKTVDGKEYVSFRARFWRDGKRLEITAPDIETARQRTKDALKHHESGAGHVMQFSPKQAATVSAAVEKLQDIGIPLLEVVAEYVEAHKVLAGDGSLVEAARYWVAERAKRAIPNIKIPALVTEFLEAKEQDGCSARYVNDARLRLATFQKTFNVNLASVSPGDLDGYLRGINGAARTRHNVHVLIRSLFSFARSKGYLPASEKTAAEIVTRVKLKPSLIGILKPEEFDKVLQKATTSTLPAFVLQGFCGLRSAEVFRLDWSAVDFKRKLVTVNADIAKTARRRLVPIPDAAVKWLADVAQPAGRVANYGSEPTMCQMMRVAYDRAGVTPTQNCLRHSAASYRLAITGDAARTALELGNSPKMLMENYRELVSMDDAKAWFSIMPKKNKRSEKIIPLPKMAA